MISNFLSQCGSSCTSLSRSVPEIHSMHVAWMLNNQQTKQNKQSRVGSRTSHASEQRGCPSLTIGLRGLFSGVLRTLGVGSNKEAEKEVVSKSSLFCWLVGCLTSQQHASVSQGRICADNFACCHTEIEVADQTFLPHPVTVY